VRKLNFREVNSGQWDSEDLRDLANKFLLLPIA
jgi:hypothetical protein